MADGTCLKGGPVTQHLVEGLSWPTSVLEREGKEKEEEERRNEEVVLSMVTPEGREKEEDRGGGRPRCGSP